MLIGSFQQRIADLAASADSVERTDAIHRAYESVLCTTPFALLDHAHDTMLLVLQEFDVALPKQR